MSNTKKQFEWTDAMMEDTWKAARELCNKHFENNTGGIDAFTTKYQSLSDYKATLPLQQVQEDKPFVWDDKLACEWAGYLEERMKFSSTKHIPQLLIEWKQSKQSPTNLQESIGYSSYMGTERKPSTTVKDKQEWEIVSFKHGSTETYFNINSNGKYVAEKFPDEEFKIDLLLNNPIGKTYNIFSVKRLSDNTVFSIGDDVLWNDNYEIKINGFEIDEGKGYGVKTALMIYNTKGDNYNIMYAKKRSLK